MTDRPIDLVKSNLVPQLWHKKPYLTWILKLKNDTNVGKCLFPGVARLEMFGQVVDFAGPVTQSPGSHQSGPWGGSCDGSGVGQKSLYLKSGALHVLHCPFEISGMVLKSLTEAFEKSETGPYRVDLELGMLEEDAMMIQGGLTEPRVQQPEARLSEGILVYVEGQVRLSEWREWMNTWGAACEAIYLPTKLTNQLRAISPTMGVGFEWEVITELLKAYQGGKAEAILVTGGDELKAKMTEVIAGANEELLIMCRAFDETLFPAITEAQARGVDIKMIMVPTERLKDEKYPDISRLPQALKKARQTIQIRTNVAQHARVIVSELGALVGSADPDYYGLTIHRNAMVHTLNPTVVNAARLFFDKVWQESDSL